KNQTVDGTACEKFAPSQIERHGKVPQLADSGRGEENLSGAHTDNTCGSSARLFHNVESPVGKRERTVHGEFCSGDLRCGGELRLRDIKRAVDGHGQTYSSLHICFVDGAGDELNGERKALFELFVYAGAESWLKRFHALIKDLIDGSKLGVAVGHGEEVLQV